MVVGVPQHMAVSGMVRAWVALHKPAVSAQAGMLGTDLPVPWAAA